MGVVFVGELIVYFVSVVGVQCIGGFEEFLLLGQIDQFLCDGDGKVNCFGYFVDQCYVFMEYGFDQNIVYYDDRQLYVFYVFGCWRGCYCCVVELDIYIEVLVSFGFRVDKICGENEVFGC